MAKKVVVERISIPPPKFEEAVFLIKGDGAPYVQNKFSARAKEKIISDQEAGGTTRKRKSTRDPKDFEALFEEATHRERTEGWFGMPANSFRKAMISACRLVNFKMTLAKLSLFVHADGFGDDDTPLVRLIEDKKHGREMAIHAVRNATGVIDIRARPRWREWEAKVRVKWDAEQFTLEDVSNLIRRVGMQVGVGAGRPDSTSSTGMGWGTFELVDVQRVRASGPLRAVAGGK